MAYGTDYPHSSEHLVFLWLPYALSFASVFCVRNIARAQASELFLVLVIMGALAFVISTFVNNPTCASPAAYGATISRVSASILKEGYVFMFVSLTIFSSIFGRRVNFLQYSKKGLTRVLPVGSVGTIDRSSVECYDPGLEGMTDRIMILAVMLTVVTGIVPDRADNCALDPAHSSCLGATYRTVHSLGIALGVGISAIAAVVRAVHIYRLHGGASRETYNTFRLRCACGILLFSFSMMVLFLLVFFGALQPNVQEAYAMHLCVTFDTREICEGTGVPSSWRAATSNANLSWPCVWDDAASVTSTPCINPQCGEDVIRVNANTIIAEYNLLLYWLTTMVNLLLIVEAQASGTWLPVGPREDASRSA